MSEQDLRLSDAEREQAAADLGEHYAQGRITTEEHRERLDQIWAARTRRELGPIFADLPGRSFPPRATTAARPAAPHRPGWRRIPPPPGRHRWPRRWSRAPRCANCRTMRPR